jgi:POT family proton-dependent oligopeptide transporter
MPRDRDTAFFGHPIGLATLFFTEMWERFSYYGMRAFLIAYLAAPEDLGGRGMFFVNKDGEYEANASAGAVVGVFGAAVYLLSLPGGWIADRFIGQRKAVFVGGIGIAIGNGLLAWPDAGSLFYVGLVLIAIGTGFLKPNISTIVGQLYTAEDKRRDSGYTIYYMGINIGATLAPLVCGYFAATMMIPGVAQTSGFRVWLESKDIDPNMCWHWAFGAAALGMVGGLIQYALTQRWLGKAGLDPTIPTDPKRAARDRTVLGVIAALVVAMGLAVVFLKPSGDFIRDFVGIGLVLGSIALFVGLYKSARDGGERRRIIAMIPLYVGAIGFFGIFEQAPTTLNTFAINYTADDLGGMTIPKAWYQSVNGFFIVALAPLFAYIWIRLAKVNKEPTSVNKFAIGMVVLALSFVVMLPSLPDVGAGIKVSPMYLITLYFLYTVAELCISPVGLSSMSKLAPQRLAGMVMGTWFLGTAIGIYLAGRASAISASRGFDFLFVFLIVASLVMAAALFITAPKIKKMMGKDDHASGPADKSEKAEPEPLPTAKARKKDD